MKTNIFTTLEQWKNTQFTGRCFIYILPQSIDDPVAMDLGCSFIAKCTMVLDSDVGPTGPTSASENWSLLWLKTTTPTAAKKQTYRQLQLLQLYLSPTSSLLYFFIKRKRFPIVSGLIGNCVQITSCPATVSNAKFLPSLSTASRREGR